MKIVNGLTNYFSHSNYGTRHLKEAMKDAKDKRGIEIGGATRFSTFATHAHSILRCLPFMEQCLTSGTIPFDTAGVINLVICTNDCSQPCRRVPSVNIFNPGATRTATSASSLIKLDAYLIPFRALSRPSRANRPRRPMFSSSISALLSLFSALSVIPVRPSHIDSALLLTPIAEESFYISHQAESFAAFDRRFRIFMNDCTPGMFILAYLLDPSTL
jgi:hypothetical protein